MTDGSLASCTGTVTVAAPSPTMVTLVDGDSDCPGVIPIDPTTPPIGAVRVDAARLLWAAVRFCSASVMDAWSLRILACFAASAASVERPPDPPAVPEALDALEPEEPDELDTDPVWPAELVPCCEASCFCTVVSAEA